MRRNIFGGILVLALAALAAAPAAAQETGTPVFKAPYRSFNQYEFGASLSFPNGADFGLEGFYTFGSHQNDFGLRGGFVRSGPSGFRITRYVIGGNFRTRVLNASQQFPFDGALTVGAGANFGTGADFFQVPVGVSLGRRFKLENSTTTFTPFLHPVLDPIFGGGDSHVNFALGLGVDVNFASNLSVRVHGGIGDQPLEGISVSLAFVR